MTDALHITTSSTPSRMGTVAIVVCLLSSGCSLPKNTWFAKTDEAQQLATQARQAQDQGDCKQAEHLLTAAVKTNPRDGETRLELSELLLEQGSSDAAIRHLRQLAQQNPDDPRPVVRLAEATYARGDLVESGKLIDRALRMDPSHVDALLLRGRLYEHRRQDTEALTAYCRAFQADNERVEPQLRMADVHLRRQHPRQSGPLLRSLLERTDLTSQERTRAEWLLGQSYALEHRWPEAAESLNAAAARRRMSADDWYQLAYAAWQSHDATLARQSAAAALQINPEHEAALTMSNLLGQQTATLSTGSAAER
jgi:tetratricopeptide (TPR) repeat protein